MRSGKEEILEGVIVFAVMTGVLLPVRLFFVTYISTNWFGSFGLISAISVLLLILTKKQKLGRFGQMFERQLNKAQHGKRVKLVYGQSIFFLLILGGTIFAIESDNSQYHQIKEQISDEFSVLGDKNTLLEKSKYMQAQDWLYGIIGLFLAVFFAFPHLAAVFAVLNDTFNGWILHFYTVGFVEYLELFGILILHRFTFAQKNYQADFQT